MVLFAKLANCVEVEGIAQGVGHHDGAGLGTDGLSEPLGDRVVRAELDVDDDGREAVLNDWVDGRREAGGNGQDLVSDWYMREADTLKRTTSRLPRLYHKYAGHDNNRDSYMASQPETQAMDSILFRAWYPQIMYNHHQTGPIGTVIFAPPFRDPFNYNFDPLVPMELDLVGAAMPARFVADGKAGSTTRGGPGDSPRWTGGGGARGEAVAVRTSKLGNVDVYAV